MGRGAALTSNYTVSHSHPLAQIFLSSVLFWFLEKVLELKHFRVQTVSANRLKFIENDTLPSHYYKKKSYVCKSNYLANLN